MISSFNGTEVFTWDNEIHNIKKTAGLALLMRQNRDSFGFHKESSNFWLEVQLNKTVFIFPLNCILYYAHIVLQAQ